MTKVTKAKAERALAQIAKALGPMMGHDGPAPTGKDAAYSAEGPMLVMDWDWPSSGPTPTILLEGGPHDWAVRLSHVVNVPGVFAEPYAGYALCLYPD